jgi:hypothetical protein
MVNGSNIKKYGNVPRPIGIINKDNKYGLPFVNNLLKKKDHKCLILSFPTKEHFKDRAIPELIRNSAKELVKLADGLELYRIVVPAPGIGGHTGRLDHDKDVAPMIEDILDDRFWITFLEGK